MTAIERSRSLPALWREHRCWAPLSCCPCTRGLAPLHAALDLARDTATSSGTNHRQKNKQELFKKFLLPPATVLSCIIFLTVYSSRIQLTKVSVTHVMNFLPISWKESCVVLYTFLPFSLRVSLFLHFHIVQLSSIFGVEEESKNILSAPKLAM